MKRFGFHVKFILVAVIASFTVDAVQFNCEFRFLSISKFGGAYSCIPTVTLTGSTSLESVSGVHQTGSTNDKVGCIWIERQNLPFFPQGIVNFFKNLRALYFFETILQSISAEDLQPFPQLELLGLYMVNLTSLDGDLFKFNPLLKYISLGNNKIQHIGHDLVTNLNNLEDLSLFGNICINQSAKNRTAVAELAPQLSVLCPPLDPTTTTATVGTTTKQPTDQCSCEDEIEELRQENQQQTKEIVKLQESTVQQRQFYEMLLGLSSSAAKILLEVEKTLREISAMPIVLN